MHPYPAVFTYYVKIHNYRPLCMRRSGYSRHCVCVCVCVCVYVCVYWSVTVHAALRNDHQNWQKEAFNLDI